MKDPNVEPEKDRNPIDPPQHDAEIEHDNFDEHQSIYEEGNHKVVIQIHSPKMKYYANKRKQSGKEFVSIFSLSADTENPQATLSAVMEPVGYSDEKAFRKIFSKSTGLSPADYKSKYCKEIVG